MRLLLVVALCLIQLAVSLDVHSYEAEDAFHMIPITHTHSCLAGSSRAYATISQASYVVFTVNAPRDDEYAAQLAFGSCLSSSEKSMKFSVNGIPNSNVLFSDADHSYGWSAMTTGLKLRRGVNTIAVETDADSVALDYLNITGTIPLASRGATLNYVDYEAEDSSYTGTLIGPSFVYKTLPSEASQRMAVQLKSTSQYVEITLTEPANAITVRLSMPDAPPVNRGPSGLNSTLIISADGSQIVKMGVTSMYAWQYGGYPYNKSPGNNAHHFYDESRTFLPKLYPAGTKVRVQGADASIVYTIDLVSAYNVPAPYAQPSGYLSIADYGADATGVKDSTSAINKTIQAAKSQGKSVWIPVGTFIQNGIIVVDSITIRGAGPWHSTLYGYDLGFFANLAQKGGSKNIQLYDFAITGQTKIRDDQMADSGTGGAPSSSVFQNLWIEHTKVGMWLDGPASDLMITAVTIRNTWADGVNFHLGFSNCVVQQSMIRNTGDDGLAAWSQSQADTKIQFKFNTVQLPILANCIAIYGGQDNSMTDNIVADSIVMGSALHVGNRYSSVPISGTTTVARNTIYRGGAMDEYNPSAFYGAIWLYGQDGGMDGDIEISDIILYNSSFASIHFYGANIQKVNINNVTVKGGEYALRLESGGLATFNNMVATDLTLGGTFNCGVSFKVILGTGNSGWSDVSCKSPPIPKQ